MQIGKLDHVNIRTTQLAAMIAWYGHYLGLDAGPRPDFGFPGAWLYAGDAAVVHLVAMDAPAATGSEVGLKLEHFAFAALGGGAGATTLVARLDAGGQKYRRSGVVGTDTVAINVWDPDGNHIHVDFAGDA